MTKARPIVTDHAMIRYLERVVGVDVDQHRRALEERVAQAVELGASALIGDGLRYVISGNRIVTVRPARPLAEKPG